MAPTISTTFQISFSLLLIMSSFAVEARELTGVYGGGPWQSAHATFYGGNDASGTMGIPNFNLLFKTFYSKILSY